ncbi:MAG: M28 family peptidase [Cyclobacteriaceae bacterium]|nr:M28 family peptidase [Cyclobacteriaceae bacterium]
MMVCRGLFVVVLFFTQTAFAQYSFNASQLTNDLKILSSDSLEGRRVGSEGSAKARSYIIKRLESLGIKPLLESGYVQTFSFTQSFGQVQAGDGSNILAVVEGTKKETIVISAHYDHLGVLGGKIYSGADDNASGTAALLSIAEYLTKHKPDHRIILAFFDAEEMGLRGSAHFVNSLDTKAEAFVLNINMDMISRSDKNELYACGTYHYPKLKNSVEKISLPEKFSLKFGHDLPNSGRNDWTGQSDHKNFHQKKIPFLYFGVEDHPDYHRPTDSFDKINLHFYHSSVESIIRVVRALDSSTL